MRLLYTIEIVKAGNKQGNTRISHWNSIIKMVKLLKIIITNKLLLFSSSQFSYDSVQINNSVKLINLEMSN